MRPRAAGLTGARLVESWRRSAIKGSVHSGAKVGEGKLRRLSSGGNEVRARGEDGGPLGDLGPEPAPQLVAYHGCTHFAAHAVGNPWPRSHVVGYEGYRDRPGCRPRPTGPEPGEGAAIADGPRQA